MRRIIDYNTYISEGVRDLMTSFSVEDIKDRISHMKEMEKYRLIWHAALYRKKDDIKLYIKNGVDINIKSDRGETMLMDFVRTNDYVIMKMLLQLGADPNIGNDNGETALVIASQNGSWMLVELLLLSDKLKPMVHDQLNVAIFSARQRRHWAVVKLLQLYKKKNK